MKKILLFLILSSIIVFSAQVSKQKKLRIAVIDFKGKGVSAMDAAAVAGFFRNDLVNLNMYTLVDRSNMEAILTEQQFQATGCTSNECAVKMGKLLNVQNIIVGTLTKFGDKFYVSIRMLNVETSEILLSKEESARSINDIRNATKRLAFSLVNKETPNKVPLKKKVISDNEIKAPKAEQEPIKLPTIQRSKKKSTWLSKTLATVSVVAGSYFFVKSYLNRNNANNYHTDYSNATNQDAMDYYADLMDSSYKKSKINAAIGTGCLGIAVTIYVLKF